MEERFWSKVSQPNDKGCMNWLGGCWKSGYGCFQFNKIRYRAHRFSYTITKGVIPDGKIILHSCDNRKCVNPEHLSTGTSKENSTDMVNKNRQAKGIKNGTSILTEDDVREIKILIGFGYSNRELGKIYNIAHSSIYFIRNNLQWTHIII